MTLANELGAKMLFLPPYHPALNPIEYGWSVLKRMVFKTRGAVKRNTEEMKKFVQGCMARMENEADYGVKLIRCDDFEI